MRKIISFLIILGVFGIESLSAFYSMGRTWNKESNMELAINWYNSKRKHDLAINLPPIQASSSVTESDKVVNCVGIDENSVVNLLMEQGKDYSFDSRKKIADIYKIENYYGTKEQNIKLLEMMKKDLNCDPNVAQSDMQVASVQKKLPVIYSVKESEKNIVPVSNCHGSFNNKGC